MRAMGEGTMCTCEFEGDANTVKGRLVRCPNVATVVMRPGGNDTLTWSMSGRAKPRVCDEHMQIMISPEVRASRQWSVDHFVREENTTDGRDARQLIAAAVVAANKTRVASQVPSGTPIGPQVRRPMPKATEMAEDWAPIGQCSFCGEDGKHVVSSEELDDVAICESCADGAICAFLNRSSLLAPLKGKRKSRSGASPK